ncbi:10669_t:CDS:2, partial [Gigaspora rosea]
MNFFKPTVIWLANRLQWILIVTGLAELIKLFLTVTGLDNLFQWFLIVLIQLLQGFLTSNNSKHYPQNHFKILLVGKTGAGKSTIINAITNYFRNGSLDNIKVAIQTNWLKVTEEDFPVNSEASQTPFCFNYDFTDPDNSENQYTFIDTPGLSDTLSDEQDDLNMQKIIQSAISQQHLSAIVFVADGTEARLNNAFKRLLSSLPDNLVNENLLLVLTKTTKSKFQNEVAEPKQIFCIDNRVFCSNPSVWHDDKKERRYLEISWIDSNEEIKQLLGVISKLKPVSTRDFYKMRIIIEEIKMNLQKIYLAREKFFSTKERNKMDELQPTFKTTDKENTVKSKINTDYRNIFCITCDKVCHENCKGLICDCFSFWSSTCNICRCDLSSHCKPKYKIVEQTKKISQSDRDLEAEEFLHNEKASFDELDVLKAHRRNIMNLCNQMKSICSRCDFTKELSKTVDQLKELPNHIENFVVKEE